MTRPSSMGSKRDVTEPPRIRASLAVLSQFFPAAVSRTTTPPGTGAASAICSANDASGFERTGGHAARLIAVPVHV